LAHGVITFFACGRGRGTEVLLRQRLQGSVGGPDHADFGIAQQRDEARHEGLAVLLADGKGGGAANFGVLIAQVFLQGFVLHARQAIGQRLACFAAGFAF